MSSLLRVERLTKRFRGVTANDALDLEIRPGEIHALLGENGAGKSTLMNLLYGLLAPDAGQIYWQGQPVSIASPRAALELGIGMVHQHFMLVPRLTVLENVTLGLNRKMRGDRAAAEKRLRELAKTIWPQIDPHRPIDSLSIGEKQKVEILKALFRRVRLLILDEPTAALAPSEAEDLFRIGRELTRQQGAIIFITHRLDEVMAFSDRVSVLRQGRNVGTFDTRSSSPRALASQMVGRELAPPPTSPTGSNACVAEASKAFVPTPMSVSPPLLQATHVTTPPKEGSVSLSNISLQIHPGEILGIAGVDGNGQTELVEALLGHRRLSHGEILIHGRSIAASTPEAILDRGLAVIPGDRHAAAIVDGFDLLQNGLLGLVDRGPWSKRGFLRRREVRGLAKKIVGDFSVKAASLDAPINQLSGGHQQRFVVGRTLQRDPSVLIAVYPTRGLDFESAEFIRSQLLALRDQGRGVLLVTTDLDEVIKLSDRIAVIYGGRIIGSASPTASRAEIGLLMAGVAP